MSKKPFGTLINGKKRETKAKKAAATPSVLCIPPVKSAVSCEPDCDCENDVNFSETLSEISDKLFSCLSK